MAQHVHTQVEGCTCGAGPACCCFGAAALAAPPGAAGQHAHAATGLHVPASIASVLGAVGVGLGARAFVLNRAAAVRVDESLQRVVSERLALARLLAARPPKGGTEPPSPAASTAHASPAAQATQASLGALAAEASPAALTELLTARLVRLGRLEQRLRRSLLERRFEQWVPGALQLVASGGLVLCNVPWLVAAPPGLMAVTAGLWAAFALAYTAKAVAEGAAAWRAQRAARPLGPSLSRAGTWQVLGHGLEAALWAGFGLAAASAALPVGMASGLGAALGPAGLPAGLLASLLSHLLRVPTHTSTAPSLRQLPPWRDLDAFAAAHAALERQRASLAAYVQAATAPQSLAAWRLRAEMGWQRATRPKCGPTAYEAVARRAVVAGRQEPLGEQALARTMVEVLGAELDVLRLAGQPLANLAAAGPRSMAAPKASSNCAAGDGSAATDAADGAAAGAAVDAADAGQAAAVAAAWQVQAAALAAPEAEARRLQAARAERVGALRRRWQMLADSDAPWPQSVQAAQSDLLAGDALRLETLYALGLAGELLARHRHTRPAAVATLPGLSELAFAHLIPTGRQSAELRQALAPTLRADFVRLLCAPHRLEDALRFVADESEQAMPPPPQESAGCRSCQR